MQNEETIKELVNPLEDPLVPLAPKEDNQATQQESEKIENETNLNNGYLPQSWSIYKNFRYRY